MTATAEMSAIVRGGLPPRDHNQPPPLDEILRENHAALAAEVEAVAEQANAAPRIVANDDDLGPIGRAVTEARRVKALAERAHKAEKEPFLTNGRTVDAFFKTFVERLTRIVDALEKRATDYQRAKVAEARRIQEEAARKAREEEQRQREIAARAEEANRQAAASKAEQKAEAAAERAAVAEAAAASAPAEVARVRTDGVVASARAEWTFEITDYAAVPLDALRPYLKREEVEKAIRQFVRINKGSAPLAGVRIFEDVKANFR